MSERELIGSETEMNLKKAFAGESQANRIYLFIAEYISKNIKYEHLKDVFVKKITETAYAETFHARRHFDILKMHPTVNTSTESVISCLMACIEAEMYEYTNMYPSMARKARDEGFVQIADWFEMLSRVERKHANQFKELFKMYIKESEIVIYTTQTCIYCTYAKDLLNKLNCKYIAIDLTDKIEEREALMFKTGSRTVPQIFVDGVYIGGFNDLEKYTGCHVEHDDDISEDLIRRVKEFSV